MIWRYLDSSPHNAASVEQAGNLCKNGRSENIDRMMVWSYLQRISFELEELDM